MKVKSPNLSKLYFPGDNHTSEASKDSCQDQVRGLWKLRGAQKMFHS